MASTTATPTRRESDGSAPRRVRTPVRPLPSSLSMAAMSTPRAPRVEPMCIGLFHGYELSGSGSNEYTKYVARGLARLGHQVHVLCRDRKPAALPFVRSAMMWTLTDDGSASGELMFFRDEGDLPTKETARGGAVTVHVLPHGPIRPVFVCDKQRKGDVRAFTQLTDEELDEYHRIAVQAMTAVLEAIPVQIVHANHLVYQPSICVDACKAADVPFIIFPHGSAIEYTVQRDDRYKVRSRAAVAACSAVISGSLEVAQRIEAMYDPTVPADAAALAAFQAKVSVVGVGTDTSLFRDVGLGKRAAKIANIEAFSEMFHGKCEAQSVELRARLDAGGSEEWWTAMRAYKKAYKHKLPDEEFYTRLMALPWSHREAVSHSPVIMFLGAMTVGKGIQTLITAFTSLLEKYPNGHLIIIGSGSYREVLEALVHALGTNNEALLDYIVANGVNLDNPKEGAPAEPLADVAHYLSDPDRRTQLLRSAKAGRVAEHIHFLGRVNHALLSHVFPCVDVAVFPSMLTEAYPLVLMESLANGVVPVLPDHSGFTESLRSLRAPMGDAFVDSITMPSDTNLRVTGLAGVLDALFNDLDDVRGLTSKLRRVAVQRYDWSQRCVELTTEYAKVATVWEEPPVSHPTAPQDVIGHTLTFAPSPTNAKSSAASAHKCPCSSTVRHVGCGAVAVTLGIVLGVLLQKKVLKW